VTGREEGMMTFDESSGGSLIREDHTQVAEENVSEVSLLYR